MTTQTLETRVPLSALPQVAGSSFLALGFAGRLPAAMLPLGVLLAATDATGSFAVGGLTVAGLSVGGALGGPLVGMASDRFGHRRVGVVTTLIGVAALLVFVGVSALPAPGLTLLVGVAALVGLGNPQIGSMARSRWLALRARHRHGSGLTSTAMAYESVADETSFVLGPILVSTLAQVASPTTALTVAAALALVSPIGFALHRTALAGVRRTVASRAAGTLRWDGLAGVAVVVLGVGLVFGSGPTAVTARLTELDALAVTGPTYAALGVGSALSGLLLTRVPARFGGPLRMLAAAALLLVATAGLVLALAPWALAVAYFGVGLALAPLLISAYALTERFTAPGRTSTVMTGLATATSLGVAAGAAVAGQLVDRFSAGAALAVPLASVLLAVAGACWLGRARFGRDPSGPTLSS